ncbi:MAG: carbon-nitrogen hydrolase family protein [Candidatus Electryonea clarkiae]|nr:carbon-nitrogen hydrolase family protein [Candidatus Electryonea clarkiae]MDP8289188.1 carbon-nitrogen hydrolase family protein [Candidatus Electryonea clarkiae]
MHKKTTPLKVAVIQESPIFLDKDATLKKAVALIKETAVQGAELVLFPESFMSGYPDWVWTVPASNKGIFNSHYTALFDSAVSVPGMTTNELCKAANESSVYVVMGINEKNSESSNASLYNSMLYISQMGEILGVHRKLIPTGGERLMWAQGDGASLVSFNTDIGKIGGLICWENYMPLARFAMYSAGVQIYLAPTWDSSESWLTAMRHIAREGGMFVLGCCQALRKDEIPDCYEFKKLYLEDKEWINRGNSCVVNPKGEFIAGPLDAERGILYAEIDLNEIPEQKWLLDVAGHYSRPDVFDFKIKS